MEQDQQIKLQHTTTDLFVSSASSNPILEKQLTSITILHTTLRCSHKEAIKNYFASKFGIPEPGGNDRMRAAIPCFSELPCTAASPAHTTLFLSRKSTAVDISQRAE
jgi:hypothetical protein